MGNKITVGQAAIDLMQKEHEQLCPIEYEQEIHKTYENEMYSCIERGRKKYNEDFFVVVLKKRERLLDPVYRAYFVPRKSCPTPTYDQIVYKHHFKNNITEFIWVIPDLETATVFKRSVLDIVPEEHELLKFVLDFYDGTLDALARTLNNEGV